MLRLTINFRSSRGTYRGLCSVTQNSVQKGVDGKFTENTTNDSHSGGQENLYIDEAEENEIERKRNKNRLPERVYRLYVKKEAFRPEMKHDFAKSRLRRFYGRYGKESGLNPGIMWPTREELDNILEYERLRYPSLHQSLTEIADEKTLKQQERDAYEREVNTNLEKHEQWLKEHYARIAKKAAAAEEAQRKRRELIDEISEYLGYEVDPSDPRFKEAVEQRDLEKKKAHKLKKQQENYNRMLQKLTEIAQQEEKKTDSDEEENDDDTADTNKKQ